MTNLRQVDASMALRLRMTVPLRKDGTQVLLSCIIPWMVWIIPENVTPKRLQQVKDYCWLRGGSGSSYSLIRVDPDLLNQIVSYPEITSANGLAAAKMLELIGQE